jgi:hypothetical protein
MPDRDDLKLLRIVMVLVRVIFIAGIYPLMMPSGWTWHTGHSDYPLMIVGIYAMLGVFLLIAARNPLENLSLIWFDGLVESRPRQHHGDSIIRDA